MRSMMTDSSWWASCRFSTKPCHGQEGCCAAAVTVSLEILACFASFPTTKEKSIRRIMERRFSSWPISLQRQSVRGPIHQDRRWGRKEDLIWTYLMFFLLLLLLLRLEWKLTKKKNRGGEKERRLTHGGNCSFPNSSMASRRLIGSLSRSIRTLPSSIVARSFLCDPIQPSPVRRKGEVETKMKP